MESSIYDITHCFPCYFFLSQIEPTIPNLMEHLWSHRAVFPSKGFINSVEYTAPCLLVSSEMLS